MSRTGQFRANVPLEHFGVDVVSAGEETHLRKYHRETTHPRTVQRVPLENIRAGQQVVDHDPGYQRDPQIDAMQPVRGVSLPDGKVQLKDGHHRLVEAKLRGETHLPVEHLGRGSGPCLLPHCDYDHPVAPPR